MILTTEREAKSERERRVGEREGTEINKREAGRERERE